MKQSKFNDLYLQLQGLRVQGKSYKDIQELTGLSASTIKNHITGKSNKFQKRTSKKLKSRLNYLKKSPKKYKNTIATKNDYIVTALKNKKSKKSVQSYVNKLYKSKKGLKALVKDQAKKELKGKQKKLSKKYNLDIAIIEQWSSLWKKGKQELQPKRITKKEQQLLKRFGRSK